jgi:hypothetical protein
LGPSTGAQQWSYAQLAKRGLAPAVMHSNGDMHNQLELVGDPAMVRTLFGLGQLDVQALFVHLQTSLHVLYFTCLASCTLQLLIYLRTTVTSRSSKLAGSSLAMINSHFPTTLASRFVMSTDQQSLLVTIASRVHH